MMRFNFDDYMAWSLLSPNPLFVHIPEIDSNIAFWDGMITSRSIVLCSSMAVVSNIHPSPEQTRCMIDEMLELHSFGVFDSIPTMVDIFKEHPIRDLNGWLIYPVTTKASEMKTQYAYTPQEVFNWFNPEKVAIYQTT